ncbi:hypothetical protein DWB85_18315 [Seongchinamella sediminis]|uniref:Uncharacterized protein n=2 Tax=Seongchinamella sediminis TaxID=2283635 RepID=A0A3L7DWY1_9GAMM|nr:hypothetical protein DWB85_18315 [Seongchinamella sediminis]
MLLGTIVALSAFTARAEDQQQIVVIQTFDVHANATGFIEMLDKGIKMAKKVDPDGAGDIYILASHVDPAAASQVIVYTAYPSMDAYVANKEAMERDPGLKEFSAKMQENDFIMVKQYINTMVGQY